MENVTILSKPRTMEIVLMKMEAFTECIESKDHQKSIKRCKIPNRNRSKTNSNRNLTATNKE